MFSFSIFVPLFGGDTALTRSLLARINALKEAETIKDIIVQPTFHFHKLKNKNGRDLEGYFAIDVKSRKEQWRIILQPLDENNAIKYALTLTRKHTEFYSLIQDAFREAGVIFVILPNLSGSKINGATKKIGNNIMLMVIMEYPLKKKQEKKKKQRINMQKTH